MAFDRESVAVADSLRRVGLRVTGPRLAVLRAVKARPHSTAEALVADTRRSLGSVSRQAIYGVLGTCTDAELLRRIEPAGSPALYEVRTGDNHHHLVCRKCGSVADVDCVVTDAPCLTPSDDLGYLVDEAEVVFWGYCPACRS